MTARSRLERLATSIERTPIATCVTDPRLPDNPIVAANAAFLALTGYAIDEVIGRNCRFLSNGDEGRERERLRAGIERRQPVLAELTNYRKDGSAFRNAVMIAPVLGDDGEALYFVGSQMEVPDDEATGRRRERALGPVAALTARQRQVLELMVRGRRNKQIGAALGIGEKTVKMHRAAMLARLGCATSADAIRLGVEAGLAD